MLKLEVLNTAFKGKMFRVKDGLTIGRAATCQIRAQHDALQDTHARFYLDDGKQMIEIGCDQAHLYVNGKDVVRSEVQHNDELRVGPLKLRVLDDRLVSRVIDLDALISEYELSEGESDEVHDFAKEDLFYAVTKEPSLRSRIVFTIPSKDRFIEQAQIFLARLVKQAGMDELKAEAFMTCAKELILNAHRHGHQFEESKVITLKFRDRGAKVTLSIIDQGPGFDHQSAINAIKDKDAAQAARERYQAGGMGGLGFKLITRMAEELVYNQAGNKVTFAISKKMPQ